MLSVFAKSWRYIMEVTMSEVSTVPPLSAKQSLKETWADILLTRGPVTVIALGGTGALFEGLFPVFDLRKAIFGSALLLVAAAFDLFVWMIRRRDITAELQALTEARTAAAERLEAINRDAPTTTREVKATQSLLTS